MKTSFPISSITFTVPFKLCQMCWYDKKIIKMMFSRLSIDLVTIYYTDTK